MSTRGDWMDQALSQIRAIWNGDGEIHSKVGPRPIGDGPSLLVGGGVKASFDRAAKYGDGWIQGGSGPDQLVEDLENLDEAWQAAGRDDEPHKAALGYFSL